MLFSPGVLAQTTFYDPAAIQKIELHFSQLNWDYQLDTSRYGLDGYVIADWVQINGIQYDSVGVKYKGNSSYDSTYSKNPLHLALDEVIKQSYQGVTDIKLGNGYADPSAIREVLSYSILQNYMDCPRSNFAQLYINGSYIGLYSNDESINKDFCSSHFNSSSNTFLKCNPIVIPGPTTKSNLKYIPGADSSGYYNFYELKSDYGWNELVALCDTVTNYPGSIGYNMDMDRVMWMLAFNSMLVNLDSYSGVFCQNYYLYKDKTDRFNPVVWDLNMAFGGFPSVGSGNNSMASLTIANMQQLSPTFHATDPYWPLINAVMSNPQNKKIYFAHARTLVNEQFTNSNYLTTAAQLQSLIDTAVQSDLNNFFTYTQFQGGLTTDQPFGSNTIPGISNLMGPRLTYLQSNIDFAYIGPVISNVVPSVTNPFYNSTVTITASVANANTNGVYLGFRYKKSQAFTRIFMYDDGAHNDGNSGDGVYGALLPVSSLHIDYYIYAENNDAGKFSPERAEHEFYNLQASIVLPLPGQVIINEFLAGNITDTVNENGEHADWIELYNNSSVPVSLFGLYLTDDFSNPDKSGFSISDTIQPHDFFMVWADENNSTATYHHCSFKLSQNGEGIMLSDGGVQVLDSISFGPQVNDESMGRCPDATGLFISLPQTSFDSLNCGLNIISELESSRLQLNCFPNPVKDQLFISIANQMIEDIQIRIFSVTGILLLERHIANASERELFSIDIHALENGFYFIEAENVHQHMVKKLIKQ